MTKNTRTQDFIEDRIDKEYSAFGYFNLLSSEKWHELKKKFNSELLPKWFRKYFKTDEDEYQYKVWENRGKFVPLAYTEEKYWDVLIDRLCHYIFENLWTEPYIHFNNLLPNIKATKDETSINFYEIQDVFFVFEKTLDIESMNTMSILDKYTVRDFAKILEEEGWKVEKSSADNES